MNSPIEPEVTRPAKRKRVRQKASCLACQRRKGRCEQIESDRCEGCIKRNEECVWETPALVGNVPNDIAATIGHLARRVAVLERQMSLKQDRIPAVNTPTSHIDSPVYSTNSAHTETEDAAQALEDIALGRRQYHTFGINSEVPDSHTRNATFVAPGAFTSIFLGTPPPRRSVLQGSQSENDAFLESLPDKPVSDALVQIFLSDIAWIYQILHGPTFLDECRQLWSVKDQGTDYVIDPAWFACYFMVLAWAASSLNASNMPLALKHYPAADVASLPRVWSNTAELALHASSWAAKPQLRAVQAILLKISYERPGAQSADDADEGTSFFVWLAAATRICQLLGLHRLGSDPNTMPADDPALPSQPCLLKRELAKRIFFFCLVHDWIFVSGSPGMNQIQVNSFDTDPPLNLDEDDLGLDMTIPEHPSNYMAVYSYTKNLFILAQFQRVATDLTQQRAPVGYATILQLDADLQKEIHRLEHICDFSNPRLQSFHRSLLLAILHNRVVRLHRSFFMRGMNPKTPEDKQYTESVTASLRSAEAVCRMLRELGENGHRKFLWWVPAYGLGSCIVLFVRALQKEEQGSDAQKERALIRDVRHFYELGTSPDVCSPKAALICKQACRILDGFLEQPTRNSDSPVADIFRQITTKIGTAASAPLEEYHRVDGFPDFPSFSSISSPVGRHPEPFDAEGVHSALLSLTTMTDPLMALENPTTTDWNQLLISMNTSTYWGAEV
ncbi:Zn(2)-C6 fungal-type transcription factor [Mycena sanguinolenta]|uniref:Zn(2)-C6 fungal-type transcription factor n=1 Tax=Mycena sanguinolenta TaxID=230812 RepID=A0A8H6ZCJ1_9AGAR|nr:Zn(2)-C6 fungal-type transcription factor [Mycena sanguinolenta]